MDTFSNEEEGVLDEWLPLAERVEHVLVELGFAQLRSLDLELERWWVRSAVSDAAYTMTCVAGSSFDDAALTVVGAGRADCRLERFPLMDLVRQALKFSATSAFSTLDDMDRLVWFGLRSTIPLRWLSAESAETVEHVAMLIAVTGTAARELGIRYEGVAGGRLLTGVDPHDDPNLLRAAYGIPPIAPRDEAEQLRDADRGEGVL